MHFLVNGLIRCDPMRCHQAQDVALTILSHRASGHRTYYTIRSSGLHDDGWSGTRINVVEEAEINVLYLVSSDRVPRVCVRVYV